MYKHLLKYVTLLTLCGCIAPAPSNTNNYAKQREVIIQVCVPNEEVSSVEFISYNPKSNGTRSLNFVVKTNNTSQNLFETSSNFSIGFAVKILAKATNLTSPYYVFRIRSKLSNEWSSWISPEEISWTVPKEIFYKLSKSNLPQDISNNDTPKIRYRLEAIGEYNQSRKSSERYLDIPSCL